MRSSHLLFIAALLVPDQAFATPGSPRCHTTVTFPLAGRNGRGAAASPQVAPSSLAS